MKYVGQSLVDLSNHTNMPHFHWSSLNSNTTPKKNPKNCVFFLSYFKVVGTE